MKRLLLILITLLPLMGIAQIASWDFTGENTLATSTADTYAANLDAAPILTRGSGAPASAGGNSFRTAPNAGVGGFKNDGIATTNTDYFENTFSAAPGYTLSLTSIDATFAGTNTFSASPGVTMQYAYSLDGTNFTLIGSPFVKIGNGSMSQINLSGISALQNVPANVTVTFRFYASGQTTTGGWGYNSPAAGSIGLAFGGSVTATGGCINTAATINPLPQCTSYTSPSGEIYFASGVYHDTIPNAAGCDSVLTINLTIKNNTTSTISPIACGSYTVPSGDEMYMTSGTYMDTISNAAGCDSIITINLTITGSITYYQDLDHDGFGNPAVFQPGCAPITDYVTNDDDCDDTNPAITVGTTYYADTDGDGFGDASSSIIACTPPSTGYSVNDDDCDDTNPAIGAAMLYYLDSDGDGYGSSSATGVSSCTVIGGSVTNNTDCNDNNPAIHPGATEIPNNGIDEDCNGSDLNTMGTTLGMYEFNGNSCTNAVLGVTTQPTNATFSNYATTGTNCASGTGYFNNDSWNMTTTIDLTEYNSFKITPSACYSLDLNQVKFLHRVSNAAGASATAHLRSSVDGFATDLFSFTFTATATDFNETVNLPAAFDALTDTVEFRFYVTGMGSAGATYRNDNVIVIGNINALTPTTYYADADGDGYGNPTASVTNCTAPAGYVLDNTDCDDTNEDAFPGAVWYQDSDGDGLGNNAVSLTQCLQPTNYVSDNTDCNDADAQIGSIVIYYVDGDGDGFGDASDLGTNSCAPIAGSVTNNDDCDDSDATINPGAAEVCDGIDNNCDDNIDEGFIMATYYEDADNDTYGDPASSVTDCTQPAGYVTNNTDCDDTNAAIHPGAVDNTGNTIDENCDGVDGVLGIEETILANLNVYPNPGTSSVVLNMSNGWNGFQVAFAGVDGKEVALTAVQKSANELEFNTDSLVPGVYFIRLTSDSGTALVRWVKN